MSSSPESSPDRPNDEMDSSAAAPERVDDDVDSPPASAPGQVDDELVGGVALFVAAAVFILNSGDSSMDWIFPLVLAYVLVAVGVVLTIRGLLGKGRKVSIIPPILVGRGIDVAVFVAMVIVFVFLARPVGFWLMAFITLVGASLYLANRRGLKVALQSVAMAAGVVIVGYIVLLRLFFVPLDILGTWWP